MDIINLYLQMTKALKGYTKLCRLVTDVLGGLFEFELQALTITLHFIERQESE